MTLDLMKEANATRPRSRPAEEKPSRFAQLINKVRGVKEDSKPAVPAVRYSSRRRGLDEEMGQGRRLDEEMGQDSSTEQGDEVHLIPMEERRQAGDRRPQHPSRGSGVSSSRGKVEEGSRGKVEGSIRSASTLGGASPKAATSTKKTMGIEGASKPAVNKPAGSEPKSSINTTERPSLTMSSKGGTKPNATSISVPRPKPAVVSSEPKPSLARPPSISGVGSGHRRGEAPRDLFSNI